MRKDAVRQYFVEGSCEKKVLSTLISDLRLIKPGRIKIFNPITKRFKASMITTLKRGVEVILIFDTDTNDASILKENILFLRQYGTIKRLICIPQTENLEAELEISCQIKSAKTLFQSKSLDDFKRDLCSCNNLGVVLTSHGFDISRFWSQKPKGVFSLIPNESHLIKLSNK